MRQSLPNAISPICTRSTWRQYLADGPRVFREAEMRGLNASEDAVSAYLCGPASFADQVFSLRSEAVPARKYATTLALPERHDYAHCPMVDGTVAAHWKDPEHDSGRSFDDEITFSARDFRPAVLEVSLRVSEKLARAGAQLYERFIIAELGRRIARAEASAFLLGTGRNGEPLGIFVVHESGIDTDRDVATGSATDFTADGLINATKALPAASWPHARWIFHPDGLAKIRALTHGDGTYFWTGGFGSGEERLLGFPYDVSDYCPQTFTEGSYVGALVDWRSYGICDGVVTRPPSEPAYLGIRILHEKFANTGEIGLIAFALVDGQPLDPTGFVRLKCST